MIIIRYQQQLNAQREHTKFGLHKRRVAPLDTDEADENEQVLTVQDFHEFQLTDEHLRVATVSLV